MMLSRRKGGVTESVPMIVAFFVTAMLLYSTVNIEAAFSNEVDETFTGLNRISETAAFGDFYFHDYISNGAVYSLHQKSYDLAEEGGGEDVTWRKSTVRNRESFALDIFEVLREQSKQHLSQNYRLELSGSACEFSEAGYSLDLREPLSQPTLEAEFSNSDRVTVICARDQYSTEYIATPSDYYSLLELPDNRYPLLVQEATAMFKDVQVKWSNEVEDEYTATEWSQCGGGQDAAREDARESANKDARSDIRELYSEVEKNYPRVDDFVKTVSEVASIELSTEVSQVDTRDCNCENSNRGTENCETEYKFEAVATPERAEARMWMKDTKYRVPVSSGWEKLEFRVDPYIHRFAN